MSGLIGMMGNPILVYFIAGMILAEIYIKLPNKKYENINYLAVLIIILCVSCLSMTEVSYNRLSTVGPWCLLLVATVLIWEKFGEFKAPNSLIALGTITYSLYLFHLPILQLFYGSRLSQFDFFYAGFSGFSKMIFFTAFSIIISMLIYKFIEKPFIQLGRFIVNKIPDAQIHYNSKTKSIVKNNTVQPIYEEDRPVKIHINNPRH